MANQIILNLPVEDLQKSIAFFEGLNFSVVPRFTNDTSACIHIGKGIYVMLLTKDKFRGFTPKKLSDSSQTTEVIIAIDVDTPEEVDLLVDKAVALGGRVLKTPVDYGWMYQHGFEDLDGHMWELLFMDEEKI